MWRLHMRATLHVGALVGKKGRRYLMLRITEAALDDCGETTTKIRFHEFFFQIDTHEATLYVICKLAYNTKMLYAYTQAIHEC